MREQSVPKKEVKEQPQKKELKSSSETRKTELKSSTETRKSELKTSSEVKKEGQKKYVRKS